MKELWELFSSFARIGGFTFGGGYAMLPMLQKEVVEKRQWATEDEMLDYFAIGQCTPGVIFINTATFIGYKQKGIPGAIAATVGSVFPSLCIVMFIAAVLKNFAELAVVQHAFAGIRVVVSVLILNAVMGLRKKSIVDKLCVVIAAVSFLVSVWVDISPVWIVLAAAILGIAVSCSIASCARTRPTAGEMPKPCPVKPHARISPGTSSTVLITGTWSAQASIQPAQLRTTLMFARSGK